MYDMGVTVCRDLGGKEYLLTGDGPQGSRPEADY
jgi:hypothetical protein